jgi:hypothetical protein
MFGSRGNISEAKYTSMQPIKHTAHQSGVSSSLNACISFSVV